MQRALFAFVVMLALALAAAAALGQTICGSRDQVLKQLGSQYQEAPVGIGLASNGTIVELLTSPTGTWTLLVTPPRGPTCLMGTGEGWQAIERKPKEDES